LDQIFLSEVTWIKIDARYFVEEKFLFVQNWDIGFVSLGQNINMFYPY